MTDTAAGGASFTRRCVLQLTGAAAALPAAPLQSNSLENSRMSFTPKFVDLVRNTTTTTGTNDFTLGAAMTGFTSFTAACQVGDNFYYSAIGIDKPAEREVGRGTLLAGGVIGRDPIGGIKTNFSNGTKAVALITAAEWYSDMQSGAASGPPMTATRPELAGAVPQRVAVLSEAGREGVFLFKSGDYSASVAADAAQGIYIAPVNDPSGKSGAWVRHYDGSVNVRWFGAKGDGSSDDSSAFISAIAFVKSIACNASAIYKGSPRLFIPAGEYFLGTTTLDITHTLIIEGEGGIAFGAGAGSPTKLRWADGTTGIRIQAYDTSAASIVDGPHFAGAWTQIRNIYLYGGYAGTESEAHGIHTKCTVILENLMVENFPGDALYAHTSSGSGSPNEGNSNTSRVTNCHFRNSRNGVSILGADANAWLFLGCWFTSNRAWGVDDRSFLGNSYFGCHNDGNGITADSATLGASVVSYSGNRYAVKVGQEVAAAANPPSGTAADNSWWYYMAAGDPSGTGIPAWTSGMKVRSGGAYNTDNGTGSGSASNVFAGNYSESGQGPSQWLAQYPGERVGADHQSQGRRHHLRLFPVRRQRRLPQRFEFADLAPGRERCCDDPVIGHEHCLGQGIARQRHPGRRAQADRNRCGCERPCDRDSARQRPEGEADRARADLVTYLAERVAPSLGYREVSRKPVKVSGEDRRAPFIGLDRAGTIEVDPPPALRAEHREAFIVLPALGVVPDDDTMRSDHLGGDLGAAASRHAVDDKDVEVSRPVSLRLLSIGLERVGAESMDVRSDFLEECDGEVRRRGAPDLCGPVGIVLDCDHLRNLARVPDGRIAGAILEQPPIWP
jgi:hypothetical protein